MRRAVSRGTVSGAAGDKPSDFRRVRAVIAYASSHLDEDLSLAVLGTQAALSQFRLHRLFSAIAHETTKQFTSRLRLERAAAMLLTGSLPVLGVALACGFRNHETFTRLFRRRFRMTPTAYRRLARAGGRKHEMVARHAKLVAEVGPCLKLYQTSATTLPGKRAMKYDVFEKSLAPQPVLVMRRRINRADIAKALGELLGAVFLHAQRSGATLTGQPFTRYLEWGPGLISIEAGLPIAARVEGEGDVLAELLPGGRTAVTTHRGPYGQLVDAHAAVQQWIEEHGFRATGSPWEIYVTDPADEPNPKNWRTDVFWPISS
jgi:AraC-like DNA-binding protein/effector-binding domain-containing protein